MEVNAEFVAQVVIPDNSPYHKLPTSERATLKGKMLDHLSKAGTGLFHMGLPPYPVSTSHPNVVSWSTPFRIKSDSANHLNEASLRQIVTAFLNEHYNGLLRIDQSTTQGVRYVIINGIPKCVHYDPLEDNYYSFGWAPSNWHDYASNGQLVQVHFAVGLAW